MLCPRGSICKESTHSVSSLLAAKEWWPDVTCDDLPVTVVQQTASNGRVMYLVYDQSKSLRFRKG